MNADAFWAALIIFDSGALLGVVLCWLIFPGRHRAPRRYRGHR